MKNQKGITLIALVITIIVLLILAGVAIAMLSGENGILNKASESAVQNALGAAKDQCSLLATEELTDYYDEVYVSGANVTYSTTQLDNNITAAITTNTVNVKGVDVKWESAKVTLTYTDGSNVSGDLSDGKITWGDVTIK